MEFSLTTVIQAISGVVGGGLVNGTNSAYRASGIVQLVAGAIGGIGGALAAAPLAVDLLAGSGLQGYSSILGNIVGGVLGGGALTVLAAALTGGSRR